MAARKSYLYFGGTTEKKINPIPITSETQFEFDESEVWNSNNNNEVNVETTTSSVVKRSSSRPSLKKKPLKKLMTNQRPIAANSLPVNVPDWSRILGNEYGRNNRDLDLDLDLDKEDKDGDDDYYDRLPPHEYLARTRGSSFSVHEGIGRTLKGRDLSRVRNAVWKQTGFED
ncbi:hypothetical protein M9H77_24624 [Catharanthus roseus]|uniref:Uncharacterized protein n=1 Tax=Catharanthus roseus TaxID=4058 RepID=A0ACC0AXG1_CATRO|nr:hypothetical protein M9H77_24624 [Catharanthus roseus]